MRKFFRQLATLKAVAVMACSVAAALFPITAFAAEPEGVEGGWFPVFFYAVNFLLFLWIVRRYAWPAITRFFRERSHTIRENRTRAERSYQQALELANRAAERVSHLEAEKTQLASELEQETAYQINQIRAIAEEAVNRMGRDNVVTLAALRDAAQRRLRQTMAEAAGTIARELLRRDFQTADQERLLQSFVARIGEEAGR